MSFLPSPLGKFPMMASLNNPTVSKNSLSSVGQNPLQTANYCFYISVFDQAAYTWRGIIYCTQS